MKQTPTIYIKSGCPWCREALAFFSQHGVELNVRDVNQSKGDLKRMMEISGQTLTPTFEYKDFMVADFSVEEFVSELEQRPDIKAELGLGEEDDF